MPLWIILALGAYFLLAINGVTDKFLLTKAVKHPVAYAFYVGITGPLTLLLIPIGLIGGLFDISFFKNDLSFQFLSPLATLISLIGGACFPLALYFSYKAIQQTSVSRVLPIQGGLVPFFTFLLAFLVLGERLSGNQIIAFVFLVIGAILISLQKKRGHWQALSLQNAILASLLFAACLVLTKYAFLLSNFGSGLIWTRLGFFIVSLSFLISPKSRRYIFDAPKETSTGNKFVYLGARICGFFASFMQNYAIAIGSVTLVNALQGTQYAFLLLMTIVLSIWFPKILKEDVSKDAIGIKIVSILIISTGLYFLAV